MSLENIEHEESHFFGENRKAGKAQRKLAREKDRSKFKKTDQEKYLKGVLDDQLAKQKRDRQQEGRVLSITSQGILVDCQGEQYLCTLKGLLKKEKTHLKNLVAVGDLVLFEPLTEREGIISHVQPRRTILSRADNLSRRKEQLIAVNVDQVIITASVVQPRLKPAIIDRYLIAAQKGGLSPLIVINKVDLLEDESDWIADEQAFYEAALAAYQAIGIPIFSVSTHDGRGLDALRDAMRDKISVFSGQSGVGKSSLINAMSNLDLPVGQVVGRTQKGAHTTTTTHLLPLAEGGWCVDTPGIKSFGLWDLKREEIEQYFSEIHAYGLACQFSDCSHTHEAHCRVQEALQEGVLSPLRYASYQALRESLSEEHLRR